jgi:hypothetical protein
MQCLLISNLELERTELGQAYRLHAEAAKIIVPLALGGECVDVAG